MTGTVTSERVRRLALDGGAAGVGVCSAAPFSATAEDISSRRDAGYGADLSFTFSHPEVSTDIASTFVWARSMVVVAHSYLPEAGSPGPATPGWGRIARFATTDHYEPLRRLLGSIAKELKANGHLAEVLTDDSRLVDRAAAVRAGVGWWGKNTMVLVPGSGPWVLLGSVVTDAALSADEPMRRDCGTCAACLPACPTGALIEPGVLDARLCLAYWLQAPGVIPSQLRALVGDRVYGCDDCLEACPPGGRLLEVSVARRGRVDLVELLSIDDASLQRRHGHHYIPKRNPRFVRRNALIALGNTGGEHAEAAAIAYLSHPDPLLRLHAAWAVATLDGPFGAEALSTATGTERHEAVLEELDVSVRRVAERSAPSGGR